MKLETAELSRHQTDRILSYLKRIFEQFHVTMDVDEELDDYVIYNNADIKWHYISVHEMLFGSSRMRSVFDFTKTSYEPDGFLSANTCRLFKLLMSLKSDTLEELNIKLDLLSMEHS